MMATRGNSARLERCLCCRQRTLVSASDYAICPECGWEHDSTFGLDQPSSANGGLTLRRGREKFATGRHGA